jgi:hypothetical protein
MILRPSFLARFFVACVAALASLAARAQVVPLAPGLWEVHFDRTVDGQKPPDFQERLKNMPPERRQQMEAALKARGMDVSGDEVKVCHTAATLNLKNFLNRVKDCKTNITQSSGPVWKAHTSCPSMHMESDTEVKFDGKKSYKSKTSSVSERDGRTRKTEMITTGKWLSADCGDVKPLDLRETP